MPKNNDQNSEIDPEWVKELEDVEPLKARHKKKIDLSSHEVENHDYDEEIREAIPLHMQPKEMPPQSINYNMARNTEKFIHKKELSECLSGSQPSISLDIIKSLKKGLIPLEGKLDLHGFKEEQAWQGMNNFLQNCYHQHKRCILLVHGKGKGYGEEKDMGIIKSSISSWLESSPFVLAYHTALRKHGGSGAVYVLIKKNKNI